ncbi:hypothetical protein [Parendozoicomonas haliclonae]|uniref:Uncharacterized protein n=1 Tax=Parendozoicomonas haliclonae TaxID=1960125 RepID=A0A1X7ADY6_9GAMM|nr:hypothetical protein [Parendozoicomonas haliclonae]SMA32999.1 hypothetical protein EHSB41UT_00213 [Parendozoicomonas haliclonae]
MGPTGNKPSGPQRGNSVPDLRQPDQETPKKGEAPFSSKRPVRSLSLGEQELLKSTRVPSSEFKPSQPTPSLPSRQVSNVSTTSGSSNASYTTAPDNLNQEPLPYYDPSQKIKGDLNPEKLVSVNGEEMSVVDRRDQLMGDRQAILEEQRDCLAKLHMREQEAVFLKALSDPVFAAEQGIKVVLEVSGHAIQLVPPAENEKFTPEQRESYLRFVQSSAIGMFESMPTIDELRSEKSANKKALKKVQKELKKYKVEINSDVQDKWLRNTRIILDMNNGSGTVSGEPKYELYIPDESLRHLPRARVDTDGYYLSANPRDMSESGMVNDEDLPLPYDDDGPETGSTSSGYQGSLGGSSRMSGVSSVSGVGIGDEDDEEDEGEPVKPAPMMPPPPTSGMPPEAPPPPPPGWKKGDPLPPGFGPEKEE